MGLIIVAASVVAAPMYSVNSQKALRTMPRTEYEWAHLLSYYYPSPWDLVLFPPATEGVPPLSSPETEEEAESGISLPLVQAGPDCLCPSPTLYVQGSIQKSRVTKCHGFLLVFIG